MSIAISFFLERPLYDALSLRVHGSGRPVQAPARPPGDLNPARLLGVVLDDQLLLDLGVDLGPDRELVDEDAHLLGHDLKPGGNAAPPGERRSSGSAQGTWPRPQRRRSRSRGTTGCRPGGR